MSEQILVQKSTTPLEGEVQISGAKNSVLKLMVATTLTAGTFKLSNVPHIGDMNTMIELLISMGSQVEWTGENELTIITPADLNPIVSYELVEAMRASVLVLAPLLVRCGQAEVALPGGDNLGPRPVDMLTGVLESLGAETSIEHGYIKASAQNLIGAKLALDIPSVGATETAMMAAMGAKGTTIIENAAREPEVVDLADFLNKMGVRKNITGAGTSTITIETLTASSKDSTSKDSTSKDLSNDITQEIIPANHTVLPDRIEAATFIAAVGIAGGEIFLKDARPDDMSVLLKKFQEMGMKITHDSNTSGIWASFPAKNSLTPTDVSSLPYPGVPTDALPLLVAMLSTADGASIVTENLFDGRFGYADELIRMGAYVRIEGQHAIIRGRPNLSGSQVKALDIRAGAALVCAALKAEGQTQITDIHHIDRGYDDLVGKLQKLGADISRK